MRTFFYLFFAVFFFSGEVHAQGTRKFQIWTDIDPSYSINEKWEVSGDLGYRIEPSSGGQTVYLRPGITYKSGKIVSFNVGIANFNFWSPDIFVNAELRSFQFIKVSWPRLGNFQFKHRLGLEQRWFYIPEFEFDKFVHRTRYYLEIISPKFKLFGLDSPFFMTGNFEILRDISNTELGRLLDHNRFTIGMGNHITERFRADVRYKLINFLDPQLNSFLREVDVFRIRLYYQFTSS